MASDGGDRDPTIGDDKRRAPRYPVLIEAKAQERGSFRTEVYMLDVSRTGCKVESSLQIMPGRMVELTPHGVATIGATVRWSTDSHIGCEFNEMLSEETLAAIQASRDEAD